MILSEMDREHTGKGLGQGARPGLSCSGSAFLAVTRPGDHTVHRRDTAVQIVTFTSNETSASQPLPDRRHQDP
jgi:hypothetical protein